MTDTRQGGAVPEAWTVVQEVVDQTIDLMVNYRQSGHPGGSRSKVPMLVALTLSGAMRWDVLRPDLRFGDRFVLAAGHAVPAVYGLLAAYGEILRTARALTGDARYWPDGVEQRVLTWPDLLGFRRRGGLSGHAEMEGKTRFFKFNTGPSGHGAPAALGQALVLRMVGAEQVRVFVLDGEGGLTAGVNQEVRNAAWGYGLDNFYFLVDWNDYGIDPHRISEVVPGSPESWFGAAGWRTFGTDQGDEIGEFARVLGEAVEGPNPGRRPTVVWGCTRKGRGYGKFDAPSHGSPHSPMNCPAFWATKEEFCLRHEIELVGREQPPPASPEAVREQYAENLGRVMGLFARRPELTVQLADRLLELGRLVPDELPRFRFARQAGNPWRDPHLTSPEQWPPELWAPPGASEPNRAALGRWGSYINGWALKQYGRPLFVAMAADLAHSTNVAGFAADFAADLPGAGLFHRDRNPGGVLLPSVITEMVNAGICAGAAALNLSAEPLAEWDGLAGVCSTYGSFSYLKYGWMRLLSQLAQDGQLKCGKVIWVVGHSGPETADDSRTHFGIFSPVCTQLFPRGLVVNLHPWEFNEVPVLLAAALATPAPIIALHLTRPPITIPDRQALGLPAHHAAAAGAWLLRDYRVGLPRGGTVLVQGTMTMTNVVELLPRLDEEGINVRLVAVTSRELFDRQQAPWREQMLPPSEQVDATFITNQARISMQEWSSGSPFARDYCASADWDDRWRTGGTIGEVLDEAHLSPDHLLAMLRRFAAERHIRRARLRQLTSEGPDGI